MTTGLRISIIIQLNTGLGHHNDQTLSAQTRREYKNDGRVVLTQRMPSKEHGILEHVGHLICIAVYIVLVFV
jgi:hypothetical protein